MLGVVIWANETREKAVIWCEDNAALAYLQGRDALQDHARWPESGDLVELETERDGSLRHAVQLRMLGDHGKSRLPDMLREVARPADPHLTLVASVATDTTERRADMARPRHTLRRIFATR